MEWMEWNECIKVACLKNRKKKESIVIRKKKMDGPKLIDEKNLNKTKECENWYNLD